MSHIFWCCLLVLATSCITSVRASPSSFFSPLSPTPLGSPYTNRSSHAIVSCGDSVHILGGGQSHPTKYLNDVVSLKYNSLAGVEQWSTTTTAAPWHARLDLSALVLPDDTLLIAGGYFKNVSDLDTNDLWINTQCVENDHWQQVQSNSTFPARSGFNLVYFQGSVVMVGGYTVKSLGGRYTTEVLALAYNQATHTFAENWTSYGNATWIGRSGFTAVVHNDTIFVFGGYNADNKPNAFLNDVWSLPSLGGTWIQLSQQDSPGRFPGRTAAIAAVWKNGIIYATGYNYYSPDLADVWSYSSVTQQWQLLNSTMPKRYYAAMVNHQGRLIVTGGDDYAYNYNDIWVSEYENGSPIISSSSSSSSSASMFSSSSTASSSTSSSSSVSSSSTATSSSGGSITSSSGATSSSSSTADSSSSTASTINSTSSSSSSASSSSSSTAGSDVNSAMKVAGASSGVIPTLLSIFLLLVHSV